MADPVTELISGSMIDTWRRCVRLYNYQYDRQIAPRETDWPLALGRAGHGVLASYYSSLQLGADHGAARDEAVSMAGWRAEVLGHDPKALGHILPLIEWYWAEHAGDASVWEVLGVELQVRVPQAGWEYVATVDLLVRDRRTGELIAVDHRFLVSFYTRAQARLDPQGARYVNALRATGHDLTRFTRNLIGTQPVAAAKRGQADRTKRIPLDFTARRLEIVQRETAGAAQQILAWRQIPVELRPQLAGRTVIPGDRYPSCKTCPFAELCEAEAWGEDDRAAELVATKFGPTDYSYAQEA